MKKRKYYSKNSREKLGNSAFAALGGRSVRGFDKAKKVAGLPIDTPEQREIAVKAWYKAHYRLNTNFQALNERRKLEKIERAKQKAAELLGLKWPLE